MQLARTTTDTVHGNPGERRVLPANTLVLLIPAANLPPDSLIRFWAYPLAGHRWPPATEVWAQEVGVGLTAEDVVLVNHTSIATMNKKISQVWTFRSDSNPNVEYETLQYADGSTSCNCKGWTRRVAPDGSRSCKHCRYVDMGAADQHCTATHHYENEQPPTKEQSSHAKNRICQIPQLGQRKIAV